MIRLTVLVAAVVACGCSSKTDGPSPTISSIMPAPICDAQQAITITITGSGFSPVVIDGLTGAPSVEMPRVLIGDTEIPSDGVSLGNSSGTTLQVIIPQGSITPGTYDITVENPNGHTVTSAGFVIDAPPDLVSINPSFGKPGDTISMTLTGTNFQSAMTVTLAATPPKSCGNVVVSTDGTSASCTLDLTGVQPGTYDVVVDNGDGCKDAVTLAFTVGEEFTLTGIDPPFGCRCSTTSVTIGSSAGFASTPRVEMRPHGLGAPVTLMTRVAFVDASTITAVVPSGLELGDYDVTVIDPPSAPGVAQLDNAFRVVALPPPTIEDVVPSRGSPTADTPVAIFGSNFRNPVKVELLDRTGTVVGTIASVAPTNAGRIDATLPTTGLVDDAYLVRVTDLDELTFSTFSAFIVGATGASGNLHPFGTTADLVQARRMLGAVSARDDLGNRFLYAVGGDSGTAGAVLDSAEVSQLSKFGALAAWRSIRAPNHLTTTRDAPAVVAVPLFGTDPFIPLKTYIYASGGRNAAGAVLGSIERAMVLRNADAPVVTSSVGSATVGTLDAGTWYYKVSAILDSTDPDNPGGETLPSDEAILSISNPTSAIDLAWNAVTVNGKAAVSYRVYRTAVVDGASQQELLIATVTGTSFTDNGATAGTESPLPPGSLGVWRVQTTTHGIRWGHQAAVITDTNGARFLYVVGGKSDPTTGLLGSVEVAPINAAGTVGTFVTTGTAVMATPRAFFSLAVETPATVSGFTGIARLFALGGVAAAGATNAVEQSDVTIGGGNAGWTAYGGAGNLGARAGVMAVISSDKVFAFGGAGAATPTTFTNILSTNRDIAFQSNGDIGTPIQSAAEALPSPRALGAAVIGAGFLYVVGGTSDGDDAVATTFQSF